jgi:hypothetical protein
METQTMKNVLSFSALVLAFAFSASAHGEIVAVCGPSKGYAFYVSGPLVPEKEAGWTEDGISKGSFQIIRSGDDYDVIFTDASGGTLSAKGDGAKVVGFYSTEGDLVVTLFYALTIETYVVWFRTPSPYSQAKHSAPIAKHAVFKMQCSVPRKQ